ncbi:neuroligin-4, X-linked-like [Mercenaria mercenaria]|uniref:neuroligin-4, X-linked-like n=1 Tax=Mercenaria mercenaria TaxID=6596 RepID=UPI00234F6D59|nr:neuroligin-4, X-linked-like [Mercenaria mercenaria]
MFPCKIRLSCFLQLSLMTGVLTALHEISVSTNVGTIIGNMEIVEFDGESRYVQRFLGIPYAKPPVGERRFERPEPFGKFSDTHNATFHRPHCLQTIPLFYEHLEDFDKSEDCLYLNLYIPGNTTSRENKFAVMIYVHGGSYAIGGADIYSGDILSTFNDVIVVTVNYRLNVFGFLSNGTKSSGNFGLWDARMAIQWVHDHIRTFGGDPERVTLFGNSAGGSGVMYQAMNPKNKGLFQRIISQSGTSLAFWASQRNPSDLYFQYIKDVGCDLIEFELIAKCLRNKPAEELQTESFNFVPSVDRDFVLQEPASLLSGDSLAGKSVSEFFAEIDLIDGVTSSDGAVSVPTWQAQLEKKNIDISMGVPRSYFEKVQVPARLTGVFGDTSAVLTETVIHQYTDWARPDDPVATRENMIDLESDTWFFVPAIEAVQKHSAILKKSTSFFYVFDQKPSFVPIPKWLKGATHTMDVAYVFGLHESLERKLIDDQDAIEPFKVTQDDIKLSRSLMAMWSNFAKSGNPNSPVSTATIDWPQFDSKDQKYLILSVNMTSQSVKNHPMATRVAFWKDLVPVLRRRCKVAPLTSDAPMLSVWLSSTALILFVCSIFL